MTRHHLLLMTVVGGVLVAVCSALDVASPADPTVALEVLSAVVFGAWLLGIVSGSWQSYTMRRALRRLAEPEHRFGIDYERLPRGGRRAFALGLVRPAIFVGDELMNDLSTEELRGVLLHEDHHRRTRAPLRGIALSAWLTVLGRYAVIRRLVSGRLVELERAADAHALAGGVSRKALASALLKTEHVSLPAASFGEGDDARVRALMGGHQAAPRSTMPLEWAPALLVAVALVVCHLPGWALA